MTFARNIVLLLEDEPSVVEGFKQLFEDLIPDLELIECKNYEAYESQINNIEVRDFIKCFIMDLSNTPNEQLSKSFKAAEYIMSQYHKNRVPIFVHSAYLEKYTDLDNKGTVFKVPKNPVSTKTICDTIKLMSESGFLDIFCRNGSLETKIMTQIHAAFIDQFKSNEIEGIINSIKSANPQNTPERTVEIFERIALRSVYQNVISSSGSNDSLQVNAIEHYYRRKGLPFYTGDIFRNRETEQLVFLATPRCNISNSNFDHLMFCEVKPITESQLNNFLNRKIDDRTSGETKGLKSLRMNITDDVTNSFIGERFRFLPYTPMFEGGFVDFKIISTIQPEKFVEHYEYKISLVDDLINDVIRKMTSYLQRGGISDTNYLEAQHYLEMLAKRNTSDE